MQRLRVLHLLIHFVALSSVVAFVVALAISPGTPRYRRTRHTERLQGKALYIVRTPPANDKPTTQRRANEWPHAPTVAAAQAFKLCMGAAVLVSFTGPKSPLFDLARAAGTPRPSHMHAPHAHPRAHTAKPMPA